MVDIAVFGSLNMDLVVRVPRVPDAGETLQAHGFMTNPGGKGANQAVACARLGARVAMIGRVGDDTFGEALKASLEKDDIEIRHVVTAPSSTGVALIMVDDSAQNRISLIAGANAFVGDEDVSRLQDDLVTARLLLLQLEVPMDAVQKAATLARARGCGVVLNPAPARPLPTEVWPLLDMLVLNETEAALLCGFAVHDLDSAARAADALHRRGPPNVVLTMGGDGVLACDATGCRHFPALKVTAVDTTAAGDTFIGALCAARVRGEDIDACIASGIQAGALCVTQAGAQASIPRRADLQSLSAVSRPTTVTVR